MVKESSSGNWLLTDQQTKESDMLNFTPWKAVYCPLLTVLSRSKQEGPDSWTILRRHTAQQLQEKQKKHFQAIVV